MTFKTLLLTFTLLAVAPFSTSKAVVKNLCDDMVASGRSTEEQIQKCLTKFGESDTYKENQQKKKWQKEVETAKEAQDKAKKNNIEAKKFTSADLDEAGFGKEFYAIRVDYGNPRKPKEKRITEGDALCKYLGFEKALKSIVSAEIHPTVANKNGLIIDTGFLGTVSSEPELYVDKDEKYMVRKYVEITCAKVLSKDVPGVQEELKKVVEDVIIKNDPMPTVRTADKADVNDGPRKPAGEGKTPNGYRKPEWMEDTTQKSSVAK